MDIIFKRGMQKSDSGEMQDQLMSDKVEKPQLLSSLFFPRQLSSSYTVSLCLGFKCRHFLLDNWLSLLKNAPYMTLKVHVILLSKFWIYFL